MNAMNKWAKRSVWLVLAAVLTIGCNPLQTLGFIFRDDPKVQPKFPLRPKEGPKKEKDAEISVLILCMQRQGLPIEFGGSDRELASDIANILPEMARMNKEKVRLIPADDLANYQAWARLIRDGNPTDPFLLTTGYPQFDGGRAGAVIARTRARYTRPRAKVEAEIDRFIGNPLPLS